MKTGIIPEVPIDLNTDINIPYFMRKEALQSIRMTRTAVSDENMLSARCQEVYKLAKLNKVFQRRESREQQGSVPLKKRKK